MQPNEIEPTHHHATSSFKIVLLVFALLLTGGLAYFIWVQYSIPDTTDYTAQSVRKAVEAKKADTALACGDTELYGYSLTFGDLWKGYKIKEVKPNYALVTCYFTMPTASTETTWTTAELDHDAQYASVFALSVYTPAQWTASQEEANKPTELDHNASYYWGWSQAQAVPTDLDAAYADAKNVVATFDTVP